MPVTDKKSLGNARTVLAGLRDCLIAVANGDEDEAVHTLQSLVGGSDEQFEDTLEGTEALSALIVDAHKALASDSEDHDEDYDDEEEEDDADDEDADEYEDEDGDDEDDVEESKVKTNKSKKRALLTASVAKKRSRYLDLALADVEDLEDLQIDETQGNDVDATLGGADDGDDYEDEDDTSDENEDDIEESKVTANVRKRQTERKVAKSVAATPNKKKAVASVKAKSDGRL